MDRPSVAQPTVGLLKHRRLRRDAAIVLINKFG